MPKGLTSQGVCLLTNGRATIDDIKLALQRQGFEIAKEMPPSDSWCFGGHAVLVPFLPESNGYAEVDIVNRPWPDTMGDPKTDFMTFGAWSMGHFGPFAYPGGLSRAGQQSWIWEGGRGASSEHRGFIRIRMSYVFGAEKNARCLPEHYDPLAELRFLSRAVLALFGAPGVICYFNPNGEVLCDQATFSGFWEQGKELRQFPLMLWINVRMYSLDETLIFMDTVGNSQLDVRDVEAIFPRAQYEAADVATHLRNVTYYLLESKAEIRTGEAIDGPGESDLSWTTEVVDKGTVTPPRGVLRVYPKSDRDAVREALARESRSQG